MRASKNGSLPANTVPRLRCDPEYYQPASAFSAANGDSQAYAVTISCNQAGKSRLCTAYSSLASSARLLPRSITRMVQPSGVCELCFDPG